MAAGVHLVAAASGLARQQPTPKDTSSVGDGTLTSPDPQRGLRARACSFYAVRSAAEIQEIWEFIY